MKIIAVDVGATKIAFGLVENGILKKTLKTPTEPEKGPKYIIKNKIIKNIKTLMEKGVRGIAVGAPGPLNYKTGIIYYAPNLPRWKNIKLKKILERKFKVPVKVDNDANIFALGEKRAANSVGITLGSGIGSGLIIHNKLYHGNEFAAEIGNMIVKADGRKGPQNVNGALEHYCSGIAIEKRYYKLAKKKKTMEEIAKLKDKKSYEVLDEAAHYLAIALNNIKNMFDPEYIILGGSLSKITYFTKKAISEMKKMPPKSKVKVVVSKNEHSALIGAYRLFTDWKTKTLYTSIINYNI